MIASSRAANRENRASSATRQPPQMGSGTAHLLPEKNAFK
jgi:hypothetical protein